MKHRTAALEGTLLDAAVALAESSRGPTERHFFKTYAIRDGACRAHADARAWSPSTDWNIGGPIIERERIDLLSDAAPENPGDWVAKMARGGYGEGPTPLIAAMRAYVASKFGDEVELP